MSFHPRMEYARRGSMRRRARYSSKGRDVCRPENQAKFDANVNAYPPDQRKSAILCALYLAQAQQGYLTAPRCGMSPIRSDARRRRSRTSCRTTRCSSPDPSANTS